MKHTLLILTALTLAQTLHAQGDTYLDDFKQKWRNATEYTLEIAEAMPAEYYDFKPTEDQMTFGEQMIHLTGNVNWLISSYLEGEKTDRQLRGQSYDKVETIAIMKQVFQNAAEAIDQLQEEELTEVVEFFAGPMRKRQILTLLNDHMTHHRGQAIVYARLNGIKPPSYRGW